MSQRGSGGIETITGDPIGIFRSFPGTTTLLIAIAVALLAVTSVDSGAADRVTPAVAKRARAGSLGGAPAGGAVLGGGGGGSDLGIAESESPAPTEIVFTEVARIDGLELEQSGAYAPEFETDTLPLPPEAEGWRVCLGYEEGADLGVVVLDGESSEGLLTLKAETGEPSPTPPPSPGADGRPLNECFPTGLKGGAYKLHIISDSPEWLVVVEWR